MPHTTQWIVEKRVLYSVFHGKITAEELHLFINAVRSEIREGTPMVHHISNSLDLERVEMSLATFKNLTGAYKMAGELGWQVDISRNRLNRMFVSMATQFTNVRSRGVENFDDAVEFLKRVDDTLADATWIVPDDLGDGLRRGLSQDDKTEPQR